MDSIRNCPPRDWRTLDYEKATPEELVECHFGLVSQAMKRRSIVARSRGVPMEDLFQAGCLGLVIAARRFDKSRGAHFSTYAKYWVFEMMQRLFSKSKRWLLLKEEKLERMRPQRARRDAEHRDSARVLLEILNDQERTVITRCVMEGEKDLVVAKELGVSRQRVNYVKRRAIERMALAAKRRGEMA